MKMPHKTLKNLGLLLLLPVSLSLSGCAVVAVTGAVIGTGVAVVSTAVDVGVAVGSTAINATTGLVKAAIPDGDPSP